MMMTADEAADDLALWLEVVHAADDAFLRMDESVRQEIEDCAGPREMLRMVAALANVSTDLRRRIEALILVLQNNERLPKRPSAPGGGHLRLVEEAG